MSMHSSVSYSTVATSQLSVLLVQLKLNSHTQFLMESTTLGLIPERLISQNPGSNFLFTFCIFYLLFVFTSCAICLEKHFVLT